jgi:hypothetical protein
MGSSEGRMPENGHGSGVDGNRWGKYVCEETAKRCR